jgi:SAM-dependent methyltransferase
MTEIQRRQMDTWKFYDITHRDHVVCNPTSVERLDRVIALLDLPREPRVLDIACGKGEFLMRVGERYGGPGGEALHAVGIDISPFHVAELRETAARRLPSADLALLEMSGADYTAEPGSVDLASCIGASWIFGGHRATLAALAQAARPGGLVLVGEPFWKQPPPAEYLRAGAIGAEEFATHVENVRAGEELGLAPLLALTSSDDDWDWYESLQWRAAARYAAANPDDPDVPDLLARVSSSRDAYLRWGRETLGWALYLFTRPSARASG